MAASCRSEWRFCRAIGQRRGGGGGPQRGQASYPAGRRHPRPRRDRALVGARDRSGCAWERGAAADHPGRIAVAVDARHGRVAVAGWTATAAIGVVELSRRFEDCGVATMIYTDIARDGALTGVDAAAIAALARQLRLPVIASGGVASLADIAALKAHEADGIAGVICGRALYDGRLDAGAALRLAAAGSPC